jgi:2-iminobutanoate/2-iminopropanoate deaminase
MMIDAFNPADVWSPFGPFSMAVIQGDGQIVHLKGQVALDRQGNVVGPHDMRVQVKQVLENLQRVLGAMGGQLADVISLTQYTTDIDAFVTASDIRRAFFSEPYPVTTTVQVERLYRREVVVEIAAVAEIPRSRFRHPGRSV